MKRRTILALTILALEIIYANCAQECPKDYYIIVDKNGDKIECLSCARCVVGRGLTPTCGLKLTEAQRANIECIPCVRGKTYSNEHGPSSCKSCQFCPVTLKNCTAESNTQCSKNCARGQYYDNATYDCQPCSYCCRKDNKRIAECAGQPVQSQCSVHDSLECSPKTTKNPSSTNNDDDSTGDDKGKKTLHIIIITLSVVGGIILIIIAGVFFLKWLLKLRKQRSGGCPTEQVPLENRNNNCGISKASFLIMVNPPLTSGDEIQEGKVISIICKNQGNTQDNYCFDYIYEWKKDMMDYPCRGEKIEFNSVQVRDFGKYTCQVKCRQHPLQQGANAIELDLDVLPGLNKRYKNFNEIKSLELCDKIADMLTSVPPGIGDWKRVAEKYEMEPLKINSLEEVDRRGMKLIEFLQASQTKLTVYHFCKFMKIIKQNRIVDLLENHLCCEEQERRKVDARDSGYGHDFNGEPSSSSHDRVHFHDMTYHGVGPQKNLGLNDSRQGSSDKLADNLRNGKENPDESNRKLDRQISNQSARSTGSGSASNSLKKAVGYVRQLSQNSAGYKKHENEGGDPL